MFCVNPLMPRFRSLFVAFRRPKKAAEAEAPASLQGGEQSRVFPPGRDFGGTAATAPPARVRRTRYGRSERPMVICAPAGEEGDGGAVRPGRPPTMGIRTDGVRHAASPDFRAWITAAMFGHPDAGTAPPVARSIRIATGALGFLEPSISP